MDDASGWWRASPVELIVTRRRWVRRLQVRVLGKALTLVQSENKMEKPDLRGIVRRDVAIACTLLLAAACSGRIGPGGNKRGRPVPAGIAGTGSPGVGGTNGVGTPGTAGGGSPGIGGPQSTDPSVVVVDPPPFTPAPGLLRRLTRTQFRNAIKDVFGYDVNVNELDTDSWAANFASSAPRWS